MDKFVDSGRRQITPEDRVAINKAVRDLTNKAIGYLTDDEISEQEYNNTMEGDMGHGDL